MTAHITTTYSNQQPLPKTYSFDGKGVTTFRLIWSKQIKALGGKNAYATFKENSHTSGISDNHFAFHLFGELLFLHEGEKAFSICDTTNAYACYHGFTTKAIKTNGLRVLKKIDQECIKEFKSSDTGCRHGIGHGLLEYFGPRNLDKALEACSTIQATHILGCTQGVFMEFDFPGMTSPSGNAAAIRRLSSNDPYNPCNTLNKSYQLSCYFEIIQLWDQIFEKNYEKIGTLCMQLKEREEQVACFLGAGRAAAGMSGGNILLTQSRCSLMPNNDAFLHCHAGAYWYYSATTDAAGMKEFCTDPKLDPQECREKVALIY